MSRSTSSSRRRSQSVSRSLISVPPAYAVDDPLEYGDDSYDPPPSYKTFYPGTEQARAHKRQPRKITNYQGVFVDTLLGAVVGSIFGYFVSRRTKDHRNKRAVLVQGAVMGGIFGAAIGAEHHKRKQTRRNEERKARRAREREYEREYERGCREYEDSGRGLGVVWEETEDDEEWD
jgi:hypothetical protein